MKGNKGVEVESIRQRGARKKISEGEEESSRDMHSSLLASLLMLISNSTYLDSMRMCRAEAEELSEVSPRACLGR